MGGFEIDASKHGSERPERLRLRPHILIDMATRGEFKDLNIPADDLDDKNKFDSLGSFIAFVQSLWFCAESIARVQQGLAITLLEISTVAHVVMSTFTLILWWQKPQSVARGHIIKQETIVPELETLARYERIQKRSESTFHENLQQKEHYFVSNQLRRSNATTSHSRRAFRRSAMREAQAESSFLVGAPDTLWMFHINQSRRSRDKWFDQASYFWGTAAFWAVVALYGAVHVAAWNGHFPTTVEQKMWLIASILVTSVASIYGVGALFVLRFGSQHWKDLVPSPNGPPVRFAHFLGSLAIIGHICLFVESWTSLRSLPESASATVDWLQFIPHLS